MFASRKQNVYNALINELKKGIRKGERVSIEFRYLPSPCHNLFPGLKIISQISKLASDRARNIPFRRA